MARIIELLFIAIFLYLVFQRAILPFLRGVWGVKSAIEQQQERMREAQRRYYGEDYQEETRPAQGSRNVKSEPAPKKIDRNQVQDAEFTDLE